VPAPSGPPRELADIGGGDGTMSAWKFQRLKKTRYIERGQNNHLGTWVPHVRWVDTLSSNRIYPKWHTCKRTLGAWHICIWKLFCGMCVTGNFLNGMKVNYSEP
jgi:hypothetical protein